MKVVSLMMWILIAFSAAIFGSRFKPGEWYASLMKPTWNPPNWIFGPVWTVLYLMMGISAWLVWKEGSDKRNIPLLFFIMQLVLNALWSWIFFGLRQIGFGFIEISLLWFFVLMTIFQFLRVQPLAGQLLIPYFAWVSFATFLNYTIWRLNKS